MQVFTMFYLSVQTYVFFPLSLLSMPLPLNVMLASGYMAHFGRMHMRIVRFEDAF